MPNPYSVLGVAQDADDKTIRSAYHNLALHYHPDKARDPVQGPKSEDIFKVIQNAYETLIDPEKR
ncbi:heat shock protein DnaJ, partial [Mytilinidion resinicola]